MSAKHDLKHSIIHLTRHNRDGSFKTQGNRKERLLYIADQLSEGGYKIQHMRQLKFKHVKYLVDRWLQENLSAGTIKNRMTDLRWAMSKFDKAGVIPATNAALNIPNRQYVTNEDKSISISEGDLSKVTDENVKMSLILQREFGLRREESIKIRIHEAVIGDELHLKSSWCKGGRARTIKIRYPEQWQAIEQVKAFLGERQRALIPDDKKYVEQETMYRNQTGRADIHHAHGLRHAYAQRRYEDLTGWPCAAKGGLSKREMTVAQLALDKTARQTISADLGHSRLEIVSVYCGR
ncbi:MAG: integrase domain-containing protein [Coxiellaceae bacterium]|nr:integrase domain-containing protein [Coxiellaceae bacterium]